MTAADRVVDLLRERDCRPVRSGAGWQARCPAHDDRNPSLSVRPIEGQALVHCFASCDTADVLAALDLTMRDLFDEPSGVTYRYDDGRTVHRSPDRRFHQSGNRQGDALYRRDKVVAAVKAGQTVYVTEGEKDVHALESIGAVATTSPMGAGKWHQIDQSPLHGGTVVVVADRDEPGERHAREVQASLSGKATVSVVAPKVGKDAADHVAAGHGLDDFTPLESPICQRRLVLTLASSIRPERQRWLWADRIPLDALCLLAGREGLGKSTIATDLAAQVTRGEVGGELHGQPRDVLIVATEDNKATTIVPRLIAAKADMDRVLFVNATVDGFTGQPVFPTDTALLAGAIEETKAALVILDAATSVIDGALDGDRDRQMRQALEPLGRLAGQNACSILGIVHFGKRADSDTGKLILGSIAWSQVARAVVAVAREEDSGHLLIQPTKHNLAPGDTPAIAARLVPAEVATDDGITSVGRVEWLGETDAQATDHLGRREGDTDDAQDRDEAGKWLLDYLSEHNGEAPAGEVLKAAPKDGFPERTMQAARKRVGVRSSKSSLRGGWVWTLSPEGAAKMQKAQEHNAPAPSAPSLAPSPEPLDQLGGGSHTATCPQCGRPAWLDDGVVVCTTCEAVPA